MYGDFNGSGQPYNPYQMRLNQMQQMQQPMQAAPHYEIVQVNGEAGANMLPIGPRSSILALDQSRSDVLLAWFIQTDDAGYKTKTPYVLTPFVEKQPENDIEQRLSRLERIINEQSITTVNAANQAAATAAAGTTESFAND